ncbi:MAG: hypothetical protein ACC652_02880 [Acidimicrobiales bacterium]
MSHMVIFNGAEGQPRYHQADTLEEAVKFAEHLRNAEDLDETKIFRLSEVSFEFRPYFRVEVGGSVDESGVSAEKVEATVEEPVKKPDKKSVENIADKTTEKKAEKSLEDPVDLENEGDSPFELGSVEPAKASRIFSRS